MKYLVVTYSDFKSLHGQNVRCSYYLKELLRRGHTVHLVVTRSADEQHLKGMFGDNLIPHKFVISVPRFGRFKLIRYALFMLFAKYFIARIVKDAKPDVIFAQNLLPGYPSGIVAKKFKIEFVYDIFDFYHEMLILKMGIKSGPLFNFIKRIEIATLKRASKIVAVTSNFKNALISEGISKNKIEVVYEGADTELFTPKEPASELKKKFNLRNEMVITFVGGIEKFDGLNLLVDAAKDILKKHKNIKFMLVGDGSYLQGLRTYIEKKGILNHFIFTGWVQYNNVPDYLSISDMCVLTLIDSKITRAVATTKLYEFLASGKAVVIPSLPGVREVVKDRETAILYTAEDSNSLADAILFLLNNKMQIKRLGESGREMVKEKYDIKEESKKIADITDKLLQQFK